MRNEMIKDNDIAIEWWPVSEVKARPANARTHSKRQVQAMADSIRTFGFKVPVLVDEAGVVLAGHGRLRAAKSLGLERVPVIRHSDLTEVQKRAFVLADNKLAERAGWDRDLLAIELGELSILLPDVGLSIELSGFEAGEIDVLLADSEEMNAAGRDDEVVPLTEQPVTRLGDVWALGRHRIACGDSREIDFVNQAMGGDVADMMFTDPPYNVRVRDIVGRGQIKHDEFAMASGEMSEFEFDSFLRSVLATAVQVSRDGAIHYVCMDWRHVSNLITVANSLYGEIKNVCVWAKSNGGQGSLYRSAHELIVVSKVGAAAHTNNVELGKHGRNRTNVWHYAGVNGFGSNRQVDLAAHPTVKPVALVADAIKDVTRRGDVVLDLFGGSGTTLIAAERTSRRARLIELEPRYVDVTIRRFEALTKADAILTGSSKTFTEVAAERTIRAN